MKNPDYLTCKKCSNELDARLDRFRTKGSRIVYECPMCDNGRTQESIDDEQDEIKAHLDIIFGKVDTVDG